MTLRDIPQDSCLRSFCTYLSATEVPISYQIAGGLMTLGAICRRNRWVDQVDWRVYPNQSVLFIGPSGIGKDTIINRIQASLSSVASVSRVRTIGGTTMEGIHARLAELSKPACAFIPAPEMTAFFGKADYQANLLTGITNLLSNGDKIDITTKGVYTTSGEKFIYEPTITMAGGSTVEWLHRGMPDGTLEGGFLGRFLIVIEELGAKHVPLIKSAHTRDEIQELRDYLAHWTLSLERLVEIVRTPREMILFTEAEDAYTNWYYNRFRIFSRAVIPYANRSRDMVLRLGMLMALSRGHDRHIEEEDIQFGINLLGEVAKRIDSVVLPPSLEAQVASKVLELLPATVADIYIQLGKRFSIVRQIDPALDLLRQTGQIVQEGRTVRKVIRK